MKVEIDFDRVKNWVKANTFLTLTLGVVFAEWRVLSALMDLNSFDCNSPKGAVLILLAMVFGGASVIMFSMIAGDVYESGKQRRY